MKNLTAEQALNGATYKTANLLADLDSNFTEVDADNVALDLAKAPKNDPTFTGTVSGVTKSMVGLGNVDNTADVNKPISNDVQTALNAKAPSANPIFTGTVTIPDPPTNANDAASKNYVDTLFATGVTYGSSVVDYVAALPNGIALGERYVLVGDQHIYTSDGDNTWTDLGHPATNLSVSFMANTAVPSEVGLHVFNGTAWVYIGASGNHNDSTGIQGGGVGEYYHFTWAQWAIATQAATTAVDGYLTDTDWNTFNNKAPTANPTFTGSVVVPNDSFTYSKLQNVSATDKVLGRSSAGAGDIEEINCTAAGRALIDDATAADQKVTLGLGNVTNESKAVMFTNPTFTGTVTVPDHSFALAKLPTESIDTILGRDGSVGNTIELACTAAGRALLDDLTTAAQRTTLGLGNVTNESKATMFTSPTFTGTVAGVTKAMVGLGSVDNTADTAKPVSTAQQTALNLKANLASPTLTGVPAAPTAAVGTNTTQIATTAFVQSAMSAGGQYTIWTDGVVTFRQGARNPYFVLDQTITVTGFAGTENVDWANIRSEKLP